MNWATSGGCCSSTSETKNSAIAWPRTSSARAIRAGSRGSAQGQRRHLHGRGPPLASLMQQRQVSIGDLDAEARQQVAALGQGEIQVTVADLAQFPGHPQPVQPQRRVIPAGQHQLSCLRWPPLDEIGHVPGDRGRRDMEVIHDQRRPAGSLAASLAIEAVTSADTVPSIASRSAASAPNHGAITGAPR